MLLQIILNGNDIKIVLKNGHKVVDSFAWVGEHSLSEQLLPNIDALLKKNKIKKNQIEKISTKISAISGVTSKRIVQAVAKAWNV